VSSPLYTRTTWPTSQTGGPPWMPALAGPATFQTKSHARVADGRIQPAQLYLLAFFACMINGPNRHRFSALRLNIYRPKCAPSKRIELNRRANPPRCILTPFNVAQVVARRRTTGRNSVRDLRLTRDDARPARAAGPASHRRRWK